MSSRRIYCTEISRGILVNGSPNVPPQVIPTHQLHQNPGEKRVLSVVLSLSHIPSHTFLFFSERGGTQDHAVTEFGVRRCELLHTASSISPDDCGREGHFGGWSRPGQVSSPVAAADSRAEPPWCEDNTCDHVFNLIGSLIKLGSLVQALVQRLG